MTTKILTFVSIIFLINQVKNVDEKTERLEKYKITANLLNTPRNVASNSEITALNDFYYSLNGDSWYF